MKIKKITAIAVFIVGLILLMFLLSENSITEKEAITLTKNISEVQDYTAMLVKNNKKAEFNVEDWGSEWAVQVFEIVQEEDASHTATFGWYRISKTSGEIIKDVP